MPRLWSAFAATIVTVLLLGLAPISAKAELDADACKAQFTDPGATEISCDVTYRPSEDTVAALLSAGAPGPELEQLGAMLATTSCTTTVAADKAEVTGRWFTADQVAIPPSPVNCTMTDESGAQLEVSTMAKVDCDQPDGAWVCAAEITETTGLSFMGAVLEGLINGNPDLGKRVAVLVSELADSLGVSG